MRFGRQLGFFCISDLGHLDDDSQKEFFLSPTLDLLLPVNPSLPKIIQASSPRQRDHNQPTSAFDRKLRMSAYRCSILEYFRVCISRDARICVMLALNEGVPSELKVRRLETSRLGLSVKDKSEMDIKCSEAQTFESVDIHN